MISRVGFAPRNPRLAIEAAQAHWRTRHAEATIGLPGVRRYWQNHAVLRDGNPLLPWPGFDACSEFDFDDIPAMDRAFTSAHYAEVVKPDEDHLLDKAKGGSLTADRRLLDGAIDGRGVRLIEFLRLAALRRPADLAEVVTRLPAAGGSLAREYYRALDGREAAQRVSLFDAVEIHWFEDADRAHAYALSTEHRDRHHEMADLVRGTERLIATVHAII